MTKKHFEAIASVLAGEIALAANRGDPEQFRAVNNICRSLADLFKQDNARFDRERFYTACGLRSDGFGLPT